jgi:thioredoxin 1
MAATFKIRVRLPTASAPREFEVEPDDTVDVLAAQIATACPDIRGAVTLSSGVPPKPVSGDKRIGDAFKSGEIVVARISGTTDHVKHGTGAAPTSAGAGGHVLEIKSATQLDALLKASRKVVLDFHAVWCGPCQQIAPDIHRLAERQRGVTFAKIDVDEHQDIAMKYRVEAMPTFVFISSGRETGRVRGADVRAIEQHVTQL